MGLTFTSSCVGSGRRLGRVTGLVPDGVSGVRFRNSGAPPVLRTVRVYSNAFTILMSSRTSSLAGSDGGWAEPSRCRWLS